MPRPTTPSLTPFTEQLPDVNSPSTWATRTPLFWNWVTGPGYDNFANYLNYSEAALNYIDAALAGSETVVDAVAAIQAAGTKPIGEPFPVWDHITGCPIPSNAGAAKYIRLTAGQTGAGQYNNGLLGSESVSGSSPLVQATATILAGPMTGQTVRLINTEGAFVFPGTTSGVFSQDQMQQITGQINGVAHSGGGSSGALTDAVTFSGLAAAGATLTERNHTFNSANSPGARTGAFTAPKRVSASYYMRIA